MQLAVRWCGVAALLASSAAFALAVASRATSCVRFDSDPLGSDQARFVDCLSGQVFVDSREERARCVLGGPQRVHVVMPRTEHGALVFDPADIPSVRCVGATACGHRYRFGPERGARGIVLSVP